jgi:hypothetical protein
MTPVLEASRASQRQRATRQPDAPHPRARAELVRAAHAAAENDLVGRAPGRRKAGRRSASARNRCPARGGGTHAAGRAVVRRCRADPSTTDSSDTWPGASTARGSSSSPRAPVGAAAVSSRSSLKLDLLAHGFCREIEPRLLSERDRALHRAPVPRARVSTASPRPDSRPHRGQSALHGRRAPRSAPAPGHPAARRPVDDRGAAVGCRAGTARVRAQLDPAEDGCTRGY